MSRMRRMVWCSRMMAAVLLVLLAGAASPADRALASDQFQASLTVVAKPEHMCTGQRAQISVMLDVLVAPSSLAPLSPLEIRAIPTRGEVAPNHWEFPPTEGTNIVNLEYTAGNEGNEDILFTVEYNGDAVVGGDVVFDVYKCQYKIKLNGDQTWLHTGDQQTSTINEFYEGEGNFDLLVNQCSKGQDITISGSGSVKWEMGMRFTSPAGNCAFNPNLQGEASFRVTGSWPDGGDLNISIVFQNGQHGGGVTTCQVKGQQINGLPMPPASFTIFSQNLQGMTFSSDGDSKTFNGPPLAAPPWNVMEDVLVSVTKAGK